MRRLGGSTLRTRHFAAAVGTDTTPASGRNTHVHDHRIGLEAPGAVYRQRLSM